MTNKIHTAIEKRFKSRMTAQQIKKGSAAYKKARVEFFTGAMAAMYEIVSEGVFTNPEQLDPIVVEGKCMPPKWVFGLMRGDNFEDED